MLLQLSYAENSYQRASAAAGGHCCTGDQAYRGIVGIKVVCAGVALVLPAGGHCNVVLGPGCSPAHNTV